MSIADLVNEHASKEKKHIPEKKPKKNKKITSSLQPLQKKGKTKPTKRVKKKITAASSSSVPSPTGQEKTDRDTPTAHLLKGVLPERPQSRRDEQLDELDQKKRPPVSCLPPLIKTIKKSIKKM